MNAWRHASLGLMLMGSMPLRAIDASDVGPRQGLVLTTTTYATVIASGATLGYMDTEDHFHLSAVVPEGLTYQIRMSVTGNRQVEELSRRLVWPRTVRHEDLEESSRITLLYSSNDPESYGGQTFAETSRKVLTALKSKGETPLVIGIYGDAEGSDTGLLPGLAPAVRDNTAPAAPTAPRQNGAPLIPDMGQLFHMMFGSARHYWRGTLKRIEAQDIALPVLVNGARVTLPAVHAAGTFTFAQQTPQKVEIWWLDNADWPLTLRWTFGPASQLVTRIDWTEGKGESGNGGGGGAGGVMAAELASKSCRVELHGIYFNSGSAVLLEESEPMLRQVAAIVKASADPTLTIEGHTDDIGSADYNQKLSEQRAGAVRDALVSRYGIPAGRLTAKGYGLTRPVETNATFEGRAHNRRVELARACAAH